ncbi:MAG: P-loop NTPase [Gammaproteobacteria bacterium]|nr:P-loop NTPase [Gammaproteobacteria bacterium]
MKNNGATVHITLQGKGGIGKTMVSALLAQYLKQNSTKVACYDADPVNSSLGAFTKLEAKRVTLMQDGEINSRVFDQVFEEIISLDHSAVIDCGASSFVPLAKYLMDNETFQFLESHGKKVLIHCPIAGGQSLTDTLSGFSQLVTQLPPSVKIVVWLNEYFGLIESDGTHFNEMKVVRENAESIGGTVLLDKQAEQTFGTDIREMLTQKLTFNEIAESDKFGLMAKQRLVIFKRSVFEQLDALEC